MTASKVRIGCIGAGVLGSAIMIRLAEQGFEVAAWNRDPAKLVPVLAAGASAADSPAALTASSDFVLLCVSDDAAVDSVVFGPEGVASVGSSDKVLIDMSTCSAVRTREYAARLGEACGMAWLDAPISGGAPAAAQGRMAVMVGGDAGVFERARPVWDALASSCTLMGANGAGQTTKMINQVLVSTGFAVLAEACALAERSGVDPARIPEALAGGRADSVLLQEMMPKMAASDFAINGRISLMLKDLELIHELARDAGACMPVAATVTQAFRQLSVNGLGDRDNCELVNLYRGEQAG